MSNNLKKTFNTVCNIIENRSNEKQLILSMDVTLIISDLYNKYNDLVSFNKIYVRKGTIFSILRFR